MAARGYNRTRARDHPQPHPAQKLGIKTKNQEHRRGGKEDEKLWTDSRTIITAKKELQEPRILKRERSKGMVSLSLEREPVDSYV